MTRLAVQNPGWALANLLALALSKKGLKFVALYIGLVLLAGFTAGPMLMEAGFHEGTWAWAVLNIAFIIFMALLFLAMVAPVVALHFGNLDAETHGSARFATDKEVAPPRPYRLRPADRP